MSAVVVDVERGHGHAAAVESRERPRAIRIGLLGAGRVGSAVARVCRGQARLWRELGVEPRVIAALVRDASRSRDALGAGVIVRTDPELFIRGRYDVAVEALGGVEPARTLVARLLERGTPVVTANKSLVAACGDELETVAARHGVALRCEASVAAAIPILGTLARRPLTAQIERISGILNGTSNYVLTALEREGVSFATALAEARALGLAEPDSERDVQGVDAAEKLIVLLRHVGVAGVRVENIERCGIEPVGAADVTAARLLGGVIKPVVHAEWRDGRLAAFVGPAFVKGEHPLAGVGCEQNGLVLSGRAVGELHFAGPGAGPDVTAAAIVDDVLEAVRFGRASIGPQRRRGASPREYASPETSWLVRVVFGGASPQPVELAELFGSHGVWLQRTTEARRIDGREWLYLATHECGAARLEAALDALRAATGGETYAIRLLET